MSFFEELKRRNVFRVGVAYGVAAWVLMQVADLVLEAIEAPAWVLKALLLVVALGFVVAMVIAWAYELTPEGIKRESDVDRSQSVTGQTGRKLDRIIISFLVVAVAVLLYRQTTLEPEGTSDASEQASASPSTEVIDPQGSAAEDENSDVSDKSIAVLPFTTRSTSEDDRFFSDGMHDDLLTQLAKIADLKVISRTSMMEYRDTTKNLKQIGQELGVANILEGAVQRVGDKVRINVQLIDAATDEHLWAETYDREMSLDNLLDIQSEMSKSIAGAMQTTLSPAEEALIDRRLTNNLQALESYRRAKVLSEFFIEDDLIRAEQELRYALELDPQFAAAWAAVAYVKMSQYWGVEALDQHRIDARDAIDRGRAINPNLPELDIVEGYYHYWGFLDYPAALKVLEPVLDVYPNDVELMEVLAYVNRRYGRFDEALEFLSRAIELAPRDHRVLYSIGETYANMRVFDQAQSYLDRLIEVTPANPRAAQLSGMILSGRDGAFSEAARFYELASHDLNFMETAIWQQHVMAGDFDEAEKSISSADQLTPSMLKAESGNALLPLIGLTQIYAGNRQQGLDVLTQAHQALADDLAENPDDFLISMSYCLTTGALSLDARAACKAAESLMPDDAFDLALNLLLISRGYALGGFDDEAIELHERILNSEVGATANQLAANPAFASLKDNDRWVTLLREHGVDL